MQTSMFAIMAIFALLALSNAFEDEFFGSYNRFYQKETGADKATNSALVNDWEYCEPINSTCVTKLPSGLAADDAKAECHTNSGPKNAYDLSNSSFFALLNTGVAPQPSMQNWVDEVCGKMISSNDFVTIFIYNKAHESASRASQTAIIFQKYIRVWYLHDVLGPNSLSTRFDSNNSSLVMEYVVRYPPQGAGLSFHPQFFPNFRDEAKADSWTNLDKTDYCEPPSSFSITDNLVGASFKFELEIAYEEYRGLVFTEQLGSLEVSSFDVGLRPCSCTPTHQGDLLRRFYKITIQVASNSGTQSDKAKITSYPYFTRYMDSTLKSCETADCNNPIDGTANFVTNRDAYVILSIPSSDRKFATQDIFFEDGEGHRISDGISIVIEDESQAGKVIYKLRFSLGYSFAILAIKVTADPPGRLLSLIDLSRASQVARSTLEIQVKEFEPNHLNGDGDGDSASTLTIFASFFASVCYLF
mmetsp:Transcript_53694/g.61544  ORF Transcript_53694/g.61544 Transcript_53694/m.61544 type:complete len:473 (+) Transcript_53694:29-1447(+)